jgi:hypothetical protein
MNKIKLTLVGMVICLLLLSAGCGKDDDNPAGPQNNVPAELVGGWLYDSATLNGVPFSLALLLQWEPGTEAARFMVGSDGSLVYEELDSDSAVVWTEWGTFTVNGNTATLTITENDDGPVDPPQVLSGTWAVNGDTLTLSTIYQGATVVLTAVRYQFLPEQ